MNMKNLGNTFVKSVVREIGRNAGKGISNDLFGDWHSTPIRGQVTSTREKGRRKYANKFDQLTQKFEVGTAATTFNRVTNIVNAYITTTEDASANGGIDVVELYHLSNEAIVAKRVIKQAIEHLNDAYEGKNVDKLEKKLSLIDEYVNEFKEVVDDKAVEPKYSFGKWFVGKYQKEKKLYQALTKVKNTLSVY